MVHLRLNASETNPNEYINFISALPGQGEQPARQLLRALAAQVKPVMKTHGYSVNSFEEYEHNSVFLGRNWNNGETVEIVLRRANGSFYDTGPLLNTLCHELAHITYMDHSTRFHALWAQLRGEVEDLRARGYFGDGMWSAGTRLSDGEQVLDTALPDGLDEPEYMCGGAQKQSRRVARRRLRHQRQPRVGRTGAQTEKRGKPGRRVRGDAKFVGDGAALNQDLEGQAKSQGTGFRKQAGSKSAREARALAAERRLAQLSNASSSKNTLDGSGKADESETDDEDDADDSNMQETNDDRRKLLLDSLREAGDNEDDRLLLRKSNGAGLAVSSTCNPQSGPSTSTDNPRPKNLASSSASGSRLQLSLPSSTAKPAKPEPLAPQVPAKRKGSTLLQTEMADRKRAFLGLDQARTLGGRLQPRKPAPARQRSPIAIDDSSDVEVVGEDTIPSPAPSNNQSWSCPICTLDNRPLALVCEACETVRGPGV